VPTTLKGKYRIVDQEAAQNARNLLEMAASLPAAEEALLVESRYGSKTSHPHSLGKRFS